MSFWKKLSERATRKGQAAERVKKEASPELDAWLAAARLGDIAGLAQLRAENPELLNQASADNGECATALMTAAAFGQLAAVRQLLAWGADTLAKNPVNGMDALMLAARNGKWAELCALLPASDARQCAHGESALMLAVQHSSLEGATVADWRALVEKSDPRQPNREDDTALIMAARSGNLPAIEALLPVSDPMAESQNLGLCAWECAWMADNFEALDLMACHPSSKPWRGRLLEMLRDGSATPEHLPQTWAIEEARELREDLAAAPAMPAAANSSAPPEATPTTARRAPRRM